MNGAASGACAALRLAFAGTPEFAAIILRALVDSGRPPSVVYTQPDRPAGRGRRPRASEVKTVAAMHGIGVRQPRSLRGAEEFERLNAASVDLLVVAAYGLILPADILACPRLGCINVHASLLPRWRGAAPIQRALLAGDAATGVSIMQMDTGLDTGPVLRACRHPIAGTDTAATLLHTLAVLGAAALGETLDRIEAGDSPTPCAQDAAGVTYADRIRAAEAQIDWSAPARRIARQVRAFDPWPVAFTTLPGGDRLRVWRAQVAADCRARAAPGTVVGSSPRGIEIATGDDTLVVTEVQVAGRRRIAARDFMHSGRLAAGMLLGAPLG